MYSSLQGFENFIPIKMHTNIFLFFIARNSWTILNICGPMSMFENVIPMQYNVNIFFLFFIGQKFMGDTQHLWVITRVENLIPMKLYMIIHFFVYYQEFMDNTQHLWADAGVRECYSQSHEYQLLDSAK